MSVANLCALVTAVGGPNCPLERGSYISACVNKKKIASARNYTTVYAPGIGGLKNVKTPTAVLLLRYRLSTHLYNQDGDCFRAELPCQVTEVDEEHEHSKTECVVHARRTLNIKQQTKFVMCQEEVSDAGYGRGTGSSTFRLKYFLNDGALLNPTSPGCNYLVHFSNTTCLL